MNKPKLCFIVPRLDSKDCTHYPHIYEGIEEMGKLCNIFLFAERGTGTTEIQSIAGSYTQKLRFLPLRFLERLFIFGKLRYRGYRTFYCHYAIGSALIAKLVTKVLGGKTFLWLCIQFHHYEKPLKWGTLPDKLTKDWPIRIAIKAVDGLVTCSIPMRRYYTDVIGVNRKKIKVLPNWINLKRFDGKRGSSDLRQSLKLQGKQVVLFIHRLSERKGADRLPKLATILKQKIPNITLLIVGDGPLYNSLRQRLQSPDLKDIGKVIGSRPNREIPLLLVVADVVIVPSRIEEFGRVYLEAMAMGVPLVATDTIGARTVLGPQLVQRLVPQGDEKDVINKLTGEVVTILTNSKLRSSLIKKEKQRVNKFSLKSVVPRFVKIITS